MTLNGPKQLNGPNGVVIHGDTNDFWFFFMDFYVGRPCENFRRIQWDTILECKKRGHWRPFEIQLCAGPVARVVAAVGAAIRSVAIVLAVGEGPVAVVARAPGPVVAPHHLVR